MPSGSSDYSDVLRKLDARGFGIRPGLERMEALVELLDNPQLTYPTIHIAGTNGKSSTAWMTAAILGAHHLKTAAYTSPHLATVRERMQLTGLEEGVVATRLITKDEFAATAAYLMPYVEMVENERDEQVSYFEFSTLLAIEWMAEHAVGAGIFEAGLGGRWDATNVIEPAVAVLTPIAVDHREFLGDSALQNAEEKAGIIKQGTTVVLAAQRPEVEKLIAEKADEQQASIKMWGRDFSVPSNEIAVGGRLATVKGEFGEYRDLFIPLHGAHQAENLALAVAAAESLLGRELEEEDLRGALENIKSPGRLEIIKREPLVAIDGAHNPEGARILAAAVNESFGRRSLTMVVSIFDDKDKLGILQHLVPIAHRLIVTRSSSERSADPKELAELAKTFGGEAAAIDYLPDALKAAIDGSAPQDMVLFTGSLFAVAEARAYLTKGA